MQAKTARVSLAHLIGTTLLYSLAIATAAGVMLVTVGVLFGS